MRRFFGGVVGKKAKDYNAATKSGIFAVNEQMILNANDEWVFQPGTDISTALASTAAADTAYNEGDLTTAGMYWFDFGGSHTPAQYYYRPQSWNYTGTQVWCYPSFQVCIAICTYSKSSKSIHTYELFYSWKIKWFNYWSIWTISRSRFQ
jgi:hypothetical protein